MDKTKKLDYIDYFRAIAILLIVAGHTLGWGRSTLREIIVFFLSGATYYFVFIAGFLFWHLSNKFNIMSYYKKKILNVICPYFVTLLPVACIYAFCNSNPQVLKSSSEVVRFFAVLFNGAFVNFPLWFIGMITIIFLVSPFILFLKQKNKQVYLTVFLCSLVYTLISDRGLGLKPDLYPLAKFVLLNASCYFKICFHFLFIYLLGIETCDFIKKYPDKIKKNLKTIFQISLSVYLFHFVIHLFVLKRHQYNMQLISKLIGTFTILSGLMLLESKIQLNNCLDKCLKFLARYSFGIYFIHQYFIHLFIYHTIYNQWYGTSVLNLYKNTPHVFLIALIMFVVTLFGSILILLVIKEVLNKIGIKNTRMFVGV